jgi:hypothetical protein
MLIEQIINFVKEKMFLSCIECLAWKSFQKHFLSDQTFSFLELRGLFLPILHSSAQTMVGQG